MNKKSLKPMVYILVSLFILLLPFIVDSNYYLNMFIMTLVYIIMSSAWNFIGGYCGQLSLGHVVFYGIGAYTTILLYLNYGLSPWIGIVLGGGLAAVLASLISFPCFKLRGPFFALATIAFSQVVRLLSVYWRDLTNGSNGLYIRLNYGFSNFCFESKYPYYYIILMIAVIVLLITRYIHYSKFGLYLTAVRENEDAARAMGINVFKQKIMAMALSGFFVGVAGGFTGLYLGYIDPESVFANSISTNIMLMSIVGGNATIFGPILGAGILYPLNELLRGWIGPRAMGLNIVIYGIILILVVSVIPQGIGKKISETLSTANISFLNNKVSQNRKTS